MADTENPPFSRLFVLGDKNTPDDDFDREFSKYGAIQYLKRIKDKHTGENKGLIYVKMAKTSAAAKAVEELNGKSIAGYQRPLKVIIASNRSSENQSDDEIFAQLCRLFLVVPKSYTEDDVSRNFEPYGNIKKIVIVKDKNTLESKGLAYVTFSKASEAALAYEGCDPDFKPKFADPVSRKRQHEDSYRDDRHSSHSFSRPDHHNTSYSTSGPKDYLMNYPHQNQHCLKVRIPKGLTQMQMTRLFNIVPTLEYCRHVTSQYSATDAVYVRYSSPSCCAYAREAFNGLEYPPGCPLECEYYDDGPRGNTHQSPDPFHSPTVGYTGNAPVGPPQPLRPNAPMKKRLFIVSQPERISTDTLTDLFSRFGDLISFAYIPGKNFGFAKYASEASADQAQKSLHGEKIGGNHLKCLDAEEPPTDSKRSRQSIVKKPLSP